MKRCFAAILIPTACLLAACSTGDSDTVGAYLDQSPPGDSAVIFAPGLVSVEGRYEFAVSFSPDVQELLVTGVVPGRPAGLLHFSATDSGWIGPREVRLADGQRAEEMEAFFTPDGSRIYFAPYDQGRDVRIWAVDRDEEGWGSPRQLGPPVADDPAFYPTTTADGVIYYSNISEEGIFRATVYGDSVSEVRDTGLEAMHAFIAPDESFVLIDVREDGHDNADIFVAFRQEDGSWSPPVNLGPGVNTEFDETCPSLSPDGRFIFFSRYNEPNGVANVYWVSASVIQAAREGPAAAR